MVRRSAPTHVTDDRYFPVRVRIAVPPSGFGNQLDVMHGWLNMQFGRGNFAIHGTPNEIQLDAAFLLLRRCQRREGVRGAVRVQSYREAPIRLLRYRYPMTLV